MSAEPEKVDYGFFTDESPLDWEASEPKDKDCPLTAQLIQLAMAEASGARIPSSLQLVKEHVESSDQRKCSCFREFTSLQRAQRLFGPSLDAQTAPRQSGLAAFREGMGKPPKWYLRLVEFLRERSPNFAIAAALII